MTKLTMTLAAATLMLGSMAVGASAQTHQFGAGLHAQIQNATPIIQQAACGGFGPRCGPGWTYYCGTGPYGRTFCGCHPCR
jgi:hypothetical protein